MTKKQPLQILHISDLHIDTDKKFDMSVVFELLIKRFRDDQKKGLIPELIAVTGDIAFKGIKEEYKLAKKFFGTLLDALNLQPERIFIVPGNHDVNRKKYRKSDVPKYSKVSDLNEELENEDYRADLLKGMTDYFDFIKDNFPHLNPLQKNLVPFVYSYEAECGKKIGLVGLNSAWMCRKSQDENEIALGEYQVHMAKKELEKIGQADLYINLLHHPLDWLWEEDQTACKSCLNNSILLSGHLHRSKGGWIHNYDGSLHHFQAGGLYLGSDSPKPARFQYITFDWEKEQIDLDFRKFAESERKWCRDGETGDDGKKSFPMNMSPDIKSKKSVEKKLREEQREEKIFKDYLASTSNEHRHLTWHGFETNLRIPIELEKVYINMHAQIQAHSFDNTGVKRFQKLQEEQLSSLDIKAAFLYAKNKKIKDMVILGDPGSGKTTLLKYILLMLIDGRTEEKIGINTRIIPFFAPLRELKAPDREDFADFIKRVCGLEEFKIPVNALIKLLNNQKAIILLDGLDEVADETAREKTCQWIDRARKKYVHTQFVITSRFAGYMGKSRLKGSVLELSIQDFKPDEVEAFLMNWFQTVEAALHPENEEKYKKKGYNDALTLVEEIKQSMHIQKLAVNPLLLQIIALIRRDRKTKLPERRVELYEECINVLLEKWDMAKGLEIMLSAREAKEILRPVALWLHQEDERRSAPLKKIKISIMGPLEKIGKSGVDPEKLLINIRDRSGIFMGYSETDYGFTHLSFQEYLAAEQIRNTGTIEILLNSYQRRWWREVIILSLGLNNPSIIEEFMTRIIPTPPFQEDIGLIIDSIESSIIKPHEIFLKAIQDNDLSLEAKTNAIRVLKQIGGDTVIKKLKLITKSNEASLASSAFEALESLNASEGITKPIVKDALAIITNEPDDSKMVLIPEGTFLFGSREDDKIAHSDEKPQRSVRIDSFYMDVFPVTNRQFCDFLNKTIPDSGDLQKWINLKGSFEKERCRINKKRNIYSFEKGYEKHPVIYVSWYGADAYARWASKKLPSEQEWEKAARGTQGNIYPWGNDFKADYCNSSEGSINKLSAVDHFPDGQSPFRCYDMAGNVWEWTDSWYDEDKDKKVLRGGSWLSGSYYCRCAYRWGGPYYWDDDVGFRCART